VGRAVVASKILASAYSNRDSTFSFPVFRYGTKKGGSFRVVRLDNLPIVERGEIKHPSSVIVLDSSLLHKVDIAEGAEPGALILLNCRSMQIRSHRSSFRVAGVDAAKISASIRIGLKDDPIINTVILGAYARISVTLRFQTCCSYRNRRTG